MAIKTEIFTSQREIIRTLKVTIIDFFTQKQGFERRRLPAPATPALCAAYFLLKKKKANKYRKPVRMMFAILAERYTLAPLFCSSILNCEK